MIFNYGGRGGGEGWVNYSQLSFSQLSEELKGVALVYIYDLVGYQGYCWDALHMHMCPSDEKENFTLEPLCYFSIKIDAIIIIHTRAS